MTFVAIKIFAGVLLSMSHILIFNGNAAVFGGSFSQYDLSSCCLFINNTKNTGRIGIFVLQNIE